MWTTVLLVVAGFSALAASQAPCESPGQWDAHFSMFDPAQGHEFYVNGDYHYDKTGMRKARFERVNEGVNSTYRFVEVIDLYQEKKSYRIDVRTRECRVETIDYDFHAHDVPTGGRFRGLYYLGSSAEEEGSIELSAWDFNWVTRGYFWDGSFTTHGCIPYHSNAFNGSTFGARFESFWDVTPGLRDPNVFIPPPQCFQN
ncbi:ependymin-like [Sycon ciliatum]|uniref:ependymin-like n=1 Tax=Sycon ciliatum TaxID=27933 RepID=UPI0020A9E3B1|eukprot:scpid75046/ scgid18270/ Mammalian ependymin-related protein 1; Upregulated in colorectal cancer gene 1 protein